MKQKQPDYHEQLVLAGLYYCDTLAFFNIRTLTYRCPFSAKSMIHSWTSQLGPEFPDKNEISPQHCDLVSFGSGPMVRPFWLVPFIQMSYTCSRDGWASFLSRNTAQSSSPTQTDKCFGGLFPAGPPSSTSCQGFILILSKHDRLLVVSFSRTVDFPPPLWLEIYSPGLRPSDLFCFKDWWYLTILKE